MSPSHQIAAVQMISGAELSANLAAAARQIARAAEAGASLIALPEYFAILSPDERAKWQVREREGSGPLQDFLAGEAQRHKVWLVGGTVPLMAQDEALVRNTCLVFDPAGQRVARYDKIHLFNFQRGSEAYDEARTIEAGDQVVVFDCPLGRVGVAVCYDLRFPELFRQMGEIDLMVLPAAFTDTTGQAHWEVLLRARAIENQCYVLASAQGGIHPHGRHTYGHSLVIDPWGVVLTQLPQGEGFVCAEMERARIAAVRQSLPALRHRRI